MLKGRAPTVRKHVRSDSFHGAKGATEAEYRRRGTTAGCDPDEINGNAFSGVRISKERSGAKNRCKEACGTSRFAFLSLKRRRRFICDLLCCLCWRTGRENSEVVAIGIANRTGDQSIEKASIEKRWRGRFAAQTLIRGIRVAE